MAGFIDKLKKAAGTKSMRAEEGKKGYSEQTRDVLSKIPGSEVTPTPKARKEWTESSPQEQAKKAPEKNPSREETAKKMGEDLNKKKTPGKYKTYKKGSAQAKSFRSAFASASKAGKKTFVWEGRTYSTKKK